MDAITGDWGGKPFVDLIAGWKYVLSAYPEVALSYIYSMPQLNLCPGQIDGDRAVALGPSWGGYAMKY